MTRKSFFVLLSLIASSLYALQSSSGAEEHPELLLPGTFHGEDVKPAATGIWFGLFPIKGDGNYELRKTSVKIEKVSDEAAGDPEGQKTGKAVSVPKGEPVFLVQGVAALKEAPIQSAGVQSALINKSWKYGNILKCGEVVTLKLKDQVSQLDLTGAKTKEILQKYKIELKTGGQSQIVFAADKCQLESDNPALLWAGDLDGDNKIDLFINTTTADNTYAPTLFLSSNAGQGKLVKFAGGMQMASSE